MDTERVVKTIRKVERRFTNYTEINEQQRKRDRGKQEIFLHENKGALNALPIEESHQNWIKNHRPSLKKDNRNKHDAISIKSFLANDSSNLKFLEI